MDSWVTHNTHIFILTAAGKPVWSRWHADNYVSSSSSSSSTNGSSRTIDENLPPSSSSSSSLSTTSSSNELTRLTSIIQAVLARANEFHDPLTSMTTGTTLYLFSTYGSLHFVTVCKTGASETTLHQLLRYLHHYLLFSLTNKLHTRLQDRPNTDIRPLLQGTDIPLRTLIGMNNRSPMIWCNAFPITSLAFTLRTKLFSILGTCNEPLPLSITSTTNTSSSSFSSSSSSNGNIIYVVLTIGYSIVGWLQLKNNTEYGLRPLDTTLLLTFLNCNNTLRNADVWTPVCFPGLSESAYVHAYIAWLGSGHINNGSDTGKDGKTGNPTNDSTRGATTTAYTTTNNKDNSSTATPVVLHNMNDDKTNPSDNNGTNNTLDLTSTPTTSSIPSSSSSTNPAASVVANNGNPWFTLSNNVASSSINSMTNSIANRPRITVTSPLALLSPSRPTPLPTITATNAIHTPSTPLTSLSLTQENSTTQDTETASSTMLSSSSLPISTGITRETFVGTNGVASPGIPNCTRTTNPTNGTETTISSRVATIEDTRTTTNPNTDENNHQDDRASFEGDSIIDENETNNPPDEFGEEEEEDTDQSSVSSIDSGKEDKEEEKSSHTSEDGEEPSSSTPPRGIARLRLSLTQTGSNSSNGNYESPNVRSMNDSLRLSTPVGTSASSSSSSSTSSSSAVSSSLTSPWIPPPPSYHPDKDYSPPIFLTFITTGTNSSHLDFLTMKRNHITKLLGESGILLALIRAYSASTISVTTATGGGKTGNGVGKSNTVTIVSSSSNPSVAAAVTSGTHRESSSTISGTLPVNNGGIPFLTSDINPSVYSIKGLVHFLYIWKPLRQYTLSLWPPFLNGYTRNDHSKRKNILRAYGRIYDRLTMPIPNLRHIMYSYTGGGFDKGYTDNKGNGDDGLLFTSMDNQGMNASSGGTGSSNGGSHGGGRRNSYGNSSSNTSTNNNNGTIINTIAGINTTQAICIAVFDSSSTHTEDIPPSMEALVKLIKKDHDRLFIMSGFNAL